MSIFSVVNSLISLEENYINFRLSGLISAPQINQLTEQAEQKVAVESIGIQVEPIMASSASMHKIEMKDFGSQSEREPEKLLLEQQIQAMPDRYDKELTARTESTEQGAQVDIMSPKTMIDRNVQTPQTSQRDAGIATERENSCEIGVITDMALLPYRNSLSSSSQETQTSVPTRTVGAQISTHPHAAPLRPEWRF